MRALQFVDGVLKLSEIPKPDGEKEALIRVTKSGICNTDLEIIRGYAGFSGTIGHEFVGIVEEANDKTWIGKEWLVRSMRVAVSANFVWAEIHVIAPTARF